MNTREHHLSNLSQLQSRVYTCEFGGNHNPNALILEFSGSYGVGSEGNDDALYMAAIKAAWLTVFHVNAIVFDLRQLKYEWGNSIWNVFLWGWQDDATDVGDGAPRHVFPTALVISDLCRGGFSTCKGMVPPMFDDLDEALQFVEIPSRNYLEAFFAWVDSGSTPSV